MVAVVTRFSKKRKSSILYSGALVYIRAKTSLVLNGQRKSFVPGELILIKSGSIHDFISSSSRLFIGITPEDIYEYMSTLNIEDIISVRCHHTESFIVTKVFNPGVFEGLYNSYTNTEEQHIRKAIVNLFLTNFTGVGNSFAFFMSFFYLVLK